ncbi:MAG: 2Fe-2S iron-sulfur cluster-binding protein [Opitutales bacterium]
MSDDQKKDLITVFVDGQEVQVPPGTNMIEAAAKVAKEVPHYCYHPKLSVSGNCRMCLVELGMPGRDRATGKPILDEEGNQKLMWLPRPAIACATAAAPGMQIRTDSLLVRDCQNGVMEFLLINHPLDCPICDQAGECRLQEFATDYGRGYSRFVERKNVKPKRTVLGPRVMLDDERCILCSRCIRFCDEIAKDPVLGFIDRGSYTTLTCYPGKKLENNYSLNTVDICPVGALTSTDFRFKMRVWFLTETHSICTESSVGVNTVVSAREGKIYRITPRRNDEVNDTWMSDSGRALYKQVEAGNRLREYRVGDEGSDAETAIAAAAELLGKGKGIAFVGSGQSSVEEQFLYRKVAEAAGAKSRYLVARNGEGDGLLISADRNPNTRGALLTGLIDTLPEDRLTGLAKQIDAGKIDTVAAFNEDLAAAGLTKKQLERISIVYLGTHTNATSEAADVVIPALTVFEKSGSFVNQQFRLQKFMEVVPGPRGVLRDIHSLSLLLGRLKKENVSFSIDDVWKEMARTISPLEGLYFMKIPASGILLEAPELEGLPYVEGKSLHFEPAYAPAIAG